MRIFLIGFMGAGKTYWGKRLEEVLNYPFYDADTCIEGQHNQSVADIFASYGEDFFREEERRLLETLEEKKVFIFATGGGMPCYKDNMERMNTLGKTIWLAPSMEEILTRLCATNEAQKRPIAGTFPEGNKNEAISCWKASLIQKYEARKKIYAQAQYHLKGTDISLSNLLTLCKKTEHLPFLNNKRLFNY